MPCSGCGGKGHTPGAYYGHVLGCGASKFNDDPRYSPFTKAETDKILHEAMKAALTRAGGRIKADEPGFAPLLAESILSQLEVGCKEP